MLLPLVKGLEFWFYGGVSLMNELESFGFWTIRLKV